MLTTSERVIAACWICSLAPLAGVPTRTFLKASFPGLSQYLFLPFPDLTRARTMASVSPPVQESRGVLLKQFPPLCVWRPWFCDLVAWALRQGGVGS